VSANRQGELLERATAYPYAVPSRSFVQVGEKTLEPAEVQVDLAARTPLLAYGANAAPSVLARKLAQAPDPVAVRRASLQEFDVVYSAHISLYGAVPATLQRSAGCEAPVFVAYLTERQLTLVSQTEPNYELVLLDGACCRFEDGGSLTEVAAYLSRHGCLALAGSQIALAAVQAKGRRFPALAEPEVLAKVCDLLAPELTLEQFVVGSATDPELAGQRTQVLRKTARPLARPPISR
jgi:hypothetical protein